MLLPKDRVGYLDNALEHRAKASKQPLKGALGAFHYKVVIRKRFLAYSGLLVGTPCSCLISPQPEYSVSLGAKPGYLNLAL